MTDTTEAITWTVREYVGCGVYKDPSGKFEPELLRDEVDVQVGDVVLIPALSGGFVAAHVDEFMDDTHAVATHGTRIYYLAWGEDDRDHWVCTGHANIAAIL